MGGIIHVNIKGLAYDLSGNTIILLIDQSEERVLPMWVGMLEAHSIAVAMENIQATRPLAHDLLKTVLDQIGAKVNQVVITDLAENTFYAEIHLSISGNTTVIDSRPSDALALALRVSAPVYLSEKLAQEMMLLKDIMDEEVKEEIEKIFGSEPEQINKKHLH